MVQKIGRFSSSYLVILCKFVTDYRTITLRQTGREKLVSSMLWREVVSTANFKRDFLKVVDFVHWLKNAKPEDAKLIFYS